MLAVMPTAANEREARRRETWAWCSFAIFYLAVMGFGGVFFLRDVPLYLGYDIQHRLSGWEVIAAPVLIILIIAALVYVAAICWLFFAKIFFTRTEVSKLIFYGPTTRVERWLFDKLFPNGAGDNKG